jgi:hypothetical protein
MAMPKKGSRRILVADNYYRWKVTRNDGWIDLYIEDAENPGTVLALSFEGYEPTLVPNEHPDGASHSYVPNKAQ